jgi:hypothetical protein
MPSHPHLPGHQMKRVRVVAVLDAATRTFPDTRLVSTAIPFGRIMHRARDSPVVAAPGSAVMVG